MSKAHDGKGSDAAVWYKLYPGKLLALSHHQPDDMVFAKRHRAIALALAMQEEGMDPFSDELIQSTAEAIKAASDHGKKGADGRWKKPKEGCPSNARASSREGDGCPSNGIRRDLRDLQDVDKRKRESQEAAGAALSQFDIPSSEIFKAFGAERGFPAERVEKCFRHYETSGWKDRDGKPIGNWRAALSSWMNRPELAAQGEAEKPIPPEVSKRKEAAERRQRDIREAAEFAIAMQSWIDSGEKCPYWDNPQAELDGRRAEVEKKYGAPGLDDLGKAIAEIAAEKKTGGK